LSDLGLFLVVHRKAFADELGAAAAGRSAAPLHGASAAPPNDGDPINRAPHDGDPINRYKMLRFLS